MMMKKTPFRVKEAKVLQPQTNTLKILQETPNKQPIQVKEAKVQEPQTKKQKISEPTVNQSQNSILSQASELSVAAAKKQKQKAKDMVHHVSLEKSGLG